MRPQRWSEVILAVEPDDEYTREAADRFRYAEDNPDPDYVPPMLWLEGDVRYADPHEVDRHAVASFAGAYDRTLPARITALEVNRTRHTTFLDARASLIAQWEGFGDPVFAAPEIGITEAMALSNRECVVAATYLHYRQFRLRTFAHLAEDLSALIAPIPYVDRRQARLDGHPVPDGDDDLDRVLDAVRAGLGADEIRVALRSGAWPDGAISVMNALRQPASGT